MNNLWGKLFWIFCICFPAVFSVLAIRNINAFNGGDLASDIIIGMMGAVGSAYLIRKAIQSNWSLDRWDSF